MGTDELRTAVKGILSVLAAADLRTRLDTLRAASADDRSAAAAAVRQAGAQVAAALRTASAAERDVMARLNLHVLASPDTWERVTAHNAQGLENRGDLVRLASRVVFATQNLPNVLALLDATTGASSTPPLADDDPSRLTIRLADAGERAGNPDRLARAIDGVDMLYSACASLSPTTTVELMLEQVTGDAARDLHFVGEADVLAAVSAILDSIPEALATVDPAEPPELEALALSLPVFDDLESLSARGVLGASDVKDVAETLYQGVLLALESGAQRRGGLPVRSATPEQPEAMSPVTDNDHYAHYLREREALQLSEVSPTDQTTMTSPPSDSDAGATGPASEELGAKQGGVKEFLKSLGRTSR